MWPQRWEKGGKKHVVPRFGVVAFCATTVRINAYDSETAKLSARQTPQNKPLLGIEGLEMTFSSVCIRNLHINTHQNEFPQLGNTHHQPERYIHEARKRRARNRLTC